MTAPANAARRAWLATLARAPRQALFDLSDAIVRDHRFETLREPEAGLAMVRARIDGAGDRFNLGEATLSRCVVRLRVGSHAVTVGVGYALGRDVDRVRRVAQLDALLQHPPARATVDTLVLQPLAQLVDAARDEQARRAAATRVQFYALQPQVTP